MGTSINRMSIQKFMHLSKQQIDKILSTSQLDHTGSTQKMVTVSELFTPLSPRQSLEPTTGIPASVNVALASIFASTIDDAIDQLYVLGAGTVPKTSIKLHSIEERAQEFVADDPVFDSETGEPFEESFNRKKLLKLYFDSSKIVDILTEIKIEMRYEREHNALKDFLQELNESKVEEVELFSDEKQNYAAMNSLKQTLLSEQRDSQKHIHSLNEEIAVLKDQAEDVLFENLLRTRYIDNWENARNEQNELTCFQKENELETTISKYRNEIEKEIRVNTEIESYIFENQKDMEEAIEQWVEKYEKDSESRIVQIQVLKEKREELEVEYTALIQVYELHQQQIEEYLAYKERKRIEDERMVVLNAAAVKIQAWWRGLMVRLKLGPFNPRKGKKGKKDKDKKGKKKK